MDNYSNSYRKGSKYSAFMLKAFPLKSTDDSGMDGSLFANLIDSENGINNTKSTTSKQLTIIKGNMHKAMKKYMTNKKLSEDVKLKFKDLDNRIDNCSSSIGLYNIILETNELTNI